MQLTMRIVTKIPYNGNSIEQDCKQALCMH